MKITIGRRLFGIAVAAGIAFGAPLGAPPGARAQDPFITVASTTSTEQSGLFEHILPRFEQATGIEVRVVAQGTGQALETGRRGDVDVLFVHDTDSEEAFVAEGFAPERFDVMYNDFVLVGPKSDPAGVEGMDDVAAALDRIAGARAPFASRGDDSGTHKAERRLWQQAGVDVEDASGGWYRETGSGMGPTLNTAAAMNAYALADRGTWLNFRNRQDLEILVEGDVRLFNQYGVMQVSPERHPHVKAGQAKRFVDWLVSEEGQRAIASYEIDGRQLFFPNASKSGS
ncbi:MAG TPA: extracellular solute-binding protein [Arenibaculum sp.]|nr:extracellular solute-binding protein [Arenibaculum sp.]